MVYGVALAVLHFLHRQIVHHRFGDFVACAPPNIHHFVVAFAVGYQTLAVLVFNFFHFGIGFGKQFRFFFRDFHVVHANGNAAFGRQGKTHVHQMVGENHRIAQTAQAERCVNQLRNHFLFQRFVNVAKRQAFGQDFAQQRAPNSGVVAVDDGFVFALVIFHPLFQAHGDFGAQFHLFGVISAVHFFHIGKQGALAQAVDFVAGHVIQAQHDVLRRHDNRLAVGRREHIVRSQHQSARFHLCFQAQWHVNRHLVAVKVGVERGTH